MDMAAKELLTHTEIAAILTQRGRGRYRDGGRLFLVVDPRSKLAHWQLRYTSPTPSPRTIHGLGPADDVESTDRAREAAHGYRRIIDREGKDPIDERDRERAAAKAEAAKFITFRQAAEDFITNFKGEWSNATT